MRSLKFILASFVSGLTVFTEFRSIKESKLFFDWVDKIPLIALWTITLSFILIGIRRFIKDDKREIPFIPLIICLTSLATTYWHSWQRGKLDNSNTYFTATTYQIGSDGGFVLDFKKNGHLKAEKRDHWAVTYYWGDFSLSGDTLHLNIPLDFKLTRQAILKETSLRFINDTIQFQVFRQ